MAVVDEHELVVRGVTAMLEPFREQVEVVELETDANAGHRVDVVLCDGLARLGAGDADLDRLVHHRRVGRVVLYTWTLTDEIISSARARGVHTALPKSLNARRLASALVLVGEGLLDVDGVADQGCPSTEWAGRAAGLTAREAEIIALVTSGMSNNEIAQSTYLSINSVKSYIRSAYRTMGVSSRSCAVLWGIDHGMAPNRRRVLPPAS